MAALISTYKNTKYELYEFNELADPIWDSFVAQACGGHHVQMSLWSQLKSTLHWRVARIIVKSGDNIVGGGQLLIRSIPFIGGIGYMTKGPICTIEDPSLLQLLIDRVFYLCRRENVRYLIIQPPNNGEFIAAQLPDHGFWLGSTRVAPFSTVVNDLTLDESILLSKMNQSTRRNIRISEKKEISVREGTEDELHAFYNFYLNTSRRQKFIAYPETYIINMYQKLNPPGYLKLFLAEYQAELVSGLLVAIVGDTLELKLFGWSGLHNDRRPNEGLYWGVMKWAKSHGFCSFDWGGIDPVGAKSILENGELNKSLSQSLTRFKLGFGGGVVFYPKPYEYVFNPLLRQIYRLLFHKRGEFSKIYKIITRLHL